MGETVSINIRVDKDTKRDVEKLFENLGLNMSSAVNIFLKQCLNSNGIPFSIQAPDQNEQVYNIDGIEGYNFDSIVRENMFEYKYQKSDALNMRISPEVKEGAEAVLSSMGITLSKAIDIFLKQIIYERGIPFEVAMPKPPKSVDLSQMSKEEFCNKMLSAIAEAEEGKGRPAEEVFKEIEEELGLWSTKLE